MKTKNLMKNELLKKSVIWGYSPKGIENPNLVVKLTQNGEVGLIDLEGFEETSAKSIVKQCLTEISSDRLWGLRISRKEHIEWLNEIESIPILIVASELEGEELIYLQTNYNWLVAEVCYLAEAHEKKEWADFFLVKGSESGGLIGEKSSFILIQEFNKTGFPFVIQGGFGVFNIASALIGGAIGVVLEGQLYQLPECPLDESVKNYLASIDEHDSYVAGESFKHKYRLAGKIANSSIRQIKELEKELSTSSNQDLLLSKIDEISRSKLFFKQEEIKHSFLPLDIGYSYATYIKERFSNLSNYLSEIKEIIKKQFRRISEEWPFAENNEFAQKLGTKIPLIQGPMANVSDNADFAIEVSKHGALPVVALGGLLKEETEELFTDIKKKTQPDFNYGGGIIGLEVMKERREAHIELMKSFETPICLLAAGSIQLAVQIQKMGFKTLLHTPALSLFKDALKNEIEYEILEGSECGGHIGILSSFTLWEKILQYLDSNRGEITSKINIIFAGGISDETSSAMVATLVGYHLDIVSPGIQMGTAYMFTDEIVSTNALSTLFQEKLLDSSETQVIGTTVNTRARAIPSDFVDETLQIELTRVNDGLKISERKELYEKDNLGALRIATKGEIWNVDHVPGSGSTQFVTVSKKKQEALGCYMAGELISLKRNIIKIQDLHYDILTSGKEVAIREKNELEKYLRTPEVSLSVSHIETDLIIDNRIAVVGMGCIFPDAFSIEQFWNNITSKKYSITEIPVDRWNPKIYYNKDKTARNKTYSKIGAFVKKYEFNPIKYRIPPKIAERMDKVQKWALDAAKQALEDAGIAVDGKERKPIAVIVGNSIGGENQRNTNKGLFAQELLEDIEKNQAFKKLDTEKQKEILNQLEKMYLEKYSYVTEDTMPGELSNVIAGRIANVFNLTGKSMTTDAACASSIAAIDTAMNSLIHKDFDVVLAGGADRSMDVATYIKFCKIGALSASGTRPFDEKADGFVMGEGAGFVVLKRLEDAIKDNNKIYSVITAIGASSDGRGKGITAPNPLGQKQAVEMAYEKAKINANEVDYIEAHGTSTIVGDHVELTVLEEIFSDRDKNKKLFVSSIKSQIGHLKSAAGIASILKASLSVYHHTLPPSVNIEKLNTKIDWSKSPLTVVTDPTEWHLDAKPVRRVGVSAFGFGGTNYHAVVEEYNPSAVNYIKASLGTIQQQGKVSLPQQKSALQSIHPKLCFMFTGQGSQYLGMLKELYDNSEVVRKTFDDAEKIWYNYYSYNIKEIIFGSEKLSFESNKKRLRDTKFTQPAIYVVDVALARLFEEEGIQPNVVAGHSLGEYAALVVAGVISFEDGLRAVTERGRAMSRAGNSMPGAMAAILAPVNKVKEIVEKIKNSYITLANYNSTTQTVVSGDIDAIEQVLEIAIKEGVTAKRLNVSTAFHSQIVKPVEEEMKKVLDKIEFKTPQIPVFSNATSLPYPTDPEEMRKLLVEQISSSVKWVEEIKNIYAMGARVFVEIGPRKALYSFANDILKEKNDVKTMNTLLPKTGEIDKIQSTINDLIQEGFSPATISTISYPLEDVQRPQTSEKPVTRAQMPSQSGVLSASTDPLLDKFLQAGHEYFNTVSQVPKEVTELPVQNDFSDILIGVTGVGLGLPGKTNKVFDDENIDLILSGENFINTIDDEIKDEILNKNINRVVKSPDGSASFEEINDISQVISLAGQIGNFDPIADFGMDEKFLDSLDITSKLAICAGLEALADAGIPLVKSSRTTSTGKILEGDWVLPESLQNETGIIFASAFPGYDNLVKEINEHEELGEEKRFSRNFLFKILSMGHSQFAQIIKAKGPNTQINAACASTTQAIGIAEDWIRAGRCKRVIVIAADDATSESLLPWIGSGFLIAGGVTTKDKVEDAAIPFGKDRHGLIIASAAAAFVIESEEAYDKRGIKPIADIIGTSFSNSAFHGSRLDVKHIADAFENFISRIEKRFNITRREIAEDGMFVSHETYTPARGGSAESEIEALTRVFGSDVSKLIVVNTKGFTGHAMGAGIEEGVAIKSMEKGVIPPIANPSQIDPAFKGLNFSNGQEKRVKYAIRLAAGFGSQLAFSAFRLNTYEDRYDLIHHEKWLEEHNGDINGTFLDGRVLKLRTSSRAIKREKAVSQVAVKQDVGTISVIIKDVVSVVAEITGYETNLIEAEMHLEEDLGIDTVKQAEIFGIVREKWNLDLDESVSLAEFTTPEKIALYIQEQVQPGSISIEEPIDSTSSENTVELTNNIRRIVSEITGYEPELIEVDMDLEEDLGIDTVKQAEVFGEIRELYDLPIDESVSLAEFRTINDISAYVSPYLTTDTTQQVKISEESPVVKKEEIEDKSKVRTEEVIPSPVPLNKKSAEKINLSDLSNLIVDLYSPLTKKLEQELSKKNIPFKSIKVDEKIPPSIKEEKIDLIMVVLPDHETKPGLVDQSTYEMLFSFFQELDLNSEMKIVAISNEQFFGYVKDAYPLSGAVSGFLKTLGHEFELAFKHIYSDKLKEIIQELEFWDEYIEIAFNKGIRYTLVSTEISEVITKTSKVNFKENDLLLVTGGGRGITFKCLEALSSIVQPQVAIFGIEDVSDLTDDMLNLTEEQLQLRKQDLIDALKEKEEKVTPVLIEKHWNRFIFGLEVLQNLKTLKKKKIKAIYKTVDVTDQEKVADAIKSVEQEFKTNVTHIIHGAGLEESKSFKKKKLGFSKFIVSVKLEGMWNILKALDMKKLKRVASFTSIAGRFGNRGQVDYSYANGYLSRLSWMLNQQGIPSIACDWSAWGDVGMATRGSIMAILTSSGIMPIPLTDGTEIFVKLFLNEIGREVVVSCGLGPFEKYATTQADINSKKYPMIQKVKYEESSFRTYHTIKTSQDLYMSDHQIEGVPFFPGVMGLEMFAETYSLVTADKPKIFSDVEFTAAVKLQKSDSKEIYVEYNPPTKTMLLKSDFILKVDNNRVKENEHFRAVIGSSKRKQSKKKSHKIVNGSKMSLLSKDEIYSFFFHGDSFQVLEKLTEIHKTKAVTIVSLPEKNIFSDSKLQNMIGPLSIESALQTAGLYDYIVNDKISLPSKIDEVVIYSTKPPKYCISEFITSDSTHSTFDVVVLDEKQNTILTLKGLKMIHTQLTFKENPEIVKKIKQLKEYNDILLSFGDEKINVVSTEVIANLLTTQPEVALSYLTSKEKTSFNKYKIEKRKVEYLAGIIAAKELYAILEDDSEASNDIEIRKKTKGQPYIFNIKKNKQSNLHLSITHSGEYAIAIIGESLVGIDIELIEERKESFYKEAFTLKEQEAVSSDAELGTIYWTIKEAITKALGEGLHLSLKDIEISKDKETSSYKVDFSSQLAKELPYEADSFEIKNKSFQNYTLSYCELKKEVNK